MCVYWVIMKRNRNIDPRLATIGRSIRHKIYFMQMLNLSSRRNVPILHFNKQVSHRTWEGPMNAAYATTVTISAHQKNAQIWNVFFCFWLIDCRCNYFNAVKMSPYLLIRRGFCFTLSLRSFWIIGFWVACGKFDVKTFHRWWMFSDCQNTVNIFTAYSKRGNIRKMMVTTEKSVHYGHVVLKGSTVFIHKCATAK